MAEKMFAIKENKSLSEVAIKIYSATGALKINRGFQGSNTIVPIFLDNEQDVSRFTVIGFNVIDRPTDGWSSQSGPFVQAGAAVYLIAASFLANPTGPRLSINAQLIHGNNTSVDKIVDVEVFVMRVR
jgi:hypothetical protein